MRIGRIASVFALAFATGATFIAAAQADGYRHGPGYSDTYQPGYFIPGYGQPAYRYHDRRSLYYGNRYERPAPRYYYQRPGFVPRRDGRTYGGPSHESPMLGSPCYYDTLNGRVCI